MRLRYLARKIVVLVRQSYPAAYPGDSYPPAESRRPRTVAYGPGLVDVDVFPELEQWCDPREIETREDGAFRFKPKDA